MQKESITKITKKEDQFENVRKQMHSNTFYKAKLNLSNYSRIINTNVQEHEFIV